MKYVLIRDDDLNYFTRTEWLELLYEPFFKRGLPLNFSVIPKTKCDLPIQNPRAIYTVRENLRYEPFIPPEHRGEGALYDTGANSQLVDLIGRFENIEIVQHGFAHEYVSGEREFAMQDIDELGRRMREGKRLLEEAFGRRINFFVPPWDYLSAEALSEARKTGFLGISLYKMYREIRPPFFQRIFRYREANEFATFGRMLILKHPGYILSRFNSPAAIREKIREAFARSDILVIVNHHWEYFFDWGKIDERFFAAWKEFCDQLLARDDVELLNFTALYRRLLG